MAALSGKSRSPARRTRIANQIRIRIVSPTKAQKASRNVLSLFIADAGAWPAIIQLLIHRHIDPRKSEMQHA
jgi:hypothetical protein